MVGGKLRGVHCTVQVWRREHERLPGLYRYKLYGHFQVPGNSHNHWGGPSHNPQPPPLPCQDVTTWEFLAVQLDLSPYR